jgi:hypothetical protein
MVITLSSLWTSTGIIAAQYSGGRGLGKRPLTPSLDERRCRCIQNAVELGLEQGIATATTIYDRPGPF